ncbi:DUF2088 domain-containing protein [bacterium LRH843]|nr:DUF2088 domain-containing protein [bacterium LRH843]
MAIIDGGFNVDLPKMIKVKQHFQDDRIEKIEEAVWGQLEKEEIRNQFKKGHKIAVTVGSRGVADIDLITKAVIDKLKEYGTVPFIIPAMGSHGGGTPQGQLDILASYHITEETMGVPIEASMEVIQIGTTENSIPVYVSKPALEADGIIVMGRIKPHTNFRGPIESGLMKMMTIGLGKHRGATYVHKKGFHRFAEYIPEVGRMIIEKAPILCGIGLVENGYHEQMIVKAVLPKEIEQTDVELLKMARESMPRILFDGIDLLIVEEIGKNISGNGMDPNVTGRYSETFMMKHETKQPVQKIAVLGLTKETQGNACGIGDADVTTKSVFEEIDLHKTYANVITSTLLPGGAIPMMLDNDQQAIAVALKTCYDIEPHEAKIVRIKNTAQLDEIEISEALLAEAEKNDAIQIIGEPSSISFTENGKLI